MILNRDILDFLKRDSLFGDLMHATFKTLSIIFIATISLLLLFKPYILCQMALKPRLILIVGYGFIACISFALSFLIFAPFSKQRWTKLHEISMFSVCFVLAWLQIYFYTLINIKYLFHIYDIAFAIKLPEFFAFYLFFYTLGVGFVLYLVIHAYDIIISNERKVIGDMDAISTKENHSEKEKANGHLILKGKNKNEVLSLSIQDFVLAKSEGHYIKIFYRVHGLQNLKMCVMRNSISNIEEQLKPYDSIYRCHKSYIINLMFLQLIIKDASKSYAQIEYFEDKIPISSQKFRDIKARV